MPRCQLNRGPGLDISSLARSVSGRTQQKAELDYSWLRNNGPGVVRAYLVKINRSVSGWIELTGLLSQFCLGITEIPSPSSLTNLSSKNGNTTYSP